MDRDLLDGDPDRTRKILYSEGHNPPTFVDESLPTYETTISATGGPGRSGQGQGSKPWVAGSMTLGSDRVWMIDEMHFEIGSGPMWFKIRHSRSGSAADVEGGTLDEFYFPNAGNRDRLGGHVDPIMSIRGQGTVTVLGFGARTALTGSAGELHNQLGTNPGDAWGVRIKGQVI